MTKAIGLVVINYYVKYHMLTLIYIVVFSMVKNKSMWCQFILYVCIYIVQAVADGQPVMTNCCLYQNDIAMLNHQDLLFVTLVYTEVMVMV